MKTMFSCSLINLTVVLTGEDECDAAEYEVAAEHDDARQDDVTGERLDVLDDDGLMMLLTVDHHYLLMSLGPGHAVVRRRVPRRSLLAVSPHRLPVHHRSV